MKIKQPLLILLTSFVLAACNSGTGSTASQESSISNSTTTTSSVETKSTSTSTSDSTTKSLSPAGHVVTSTFEDNGVIYAGTEIGLFISNNDGATWELHTIANGLSSNYIQAIQVLNNVIYVINGGNAQYSKDSGKTWATISKACSDCKFTSIATNESGTLYLGSDRTTYQQGKGYITQGAYLSISSDNGASWKNSLLSNDIKSVFALNISNDKVYLLDKKATYKGMLNTSFIALKIDNSGTITETFNKSFWNQNPGFISETLNDLVVDGSNIYITTPAGFAVSTDGGSQFLLRGEGNGLNSANTYSVTKNGTSLYVGTDKGYSVSFDNGNSFASFSPSSVNHFFGSNVVNVFSNKHKVLIGTDNGIGIYNNNMNMSFDQNIADSYITSFTYSSSDNTIYATTYNSGLYKLNASNPQDILYTGTSSGLYDNNLLSATVDGSNVYVGSFGGLSISHDNGSTWTYKNKANGFSGAVTGIVANGQNLYAGTYGKGIAISHDGGNTWSYTKANGNGNAVNNMFSDSSNHIYAGVHNGGLLVSSDNGSTWKHYLDDNNIRAVFAAGYYIYAATNDGVYISTNNGSSWDKKNNGIEDKAINSIFVSAGNIYAGLDNGSVAASSDNGKSFKVYSSLPGGSTPVHAISEVNGVIMVGTEVILATSTPIN